MGRIFYLMGKSASGKDSLYKLLVNDEELNLKTVILYTTRPIREGEEEGREYHFCDYDFYKAAKEADKVIESRTYNTIHGPWTYFTLDDGQIDILNNNYIMIGTLESYEKTREYFGENVMIPVYVTVETGERLTRALEREKLQEAPRYAEMCRRFLADEEDFKQENLERCGINNSFENDILKDCYRRIKQTIIKEMKIADTVKK